MRSAHLRFLRVAWLITLVVAMTQSAAADAPPAPAIKLVTPGKGERRALRFTPTKGDKQTLVVTSQETKTRGGRGKKLPTERGATTRMTITHEVVDVSTAGDTRYEYVYRNAEVVEDGTTTADVVRQTKAVIQALVGTKGHSVVTNRGIVKEFAVAPPQGATPEARQDVEQTASIMQQMTDALPDEPIGVGAKWTTTMTVVSGELTVQTTTTHELVELSGTRGKIKLSIKMQGKGSGPGTLTTATTGTGERSFDLKRVVPMQVRLDAQTETKLDVDGEQLFLLSTSKMTATSR